MRNKQYTLCHQWVLAFRSKIEWLLEGVTVITQPSAQRNHSNEVSTEARKGRSGKLLDINLTISFILQVKKLGSKEVN
jgi:hypothetical protein